MRPRFTFHEIRRAIGRRYFRARADRWRGLRAFLEDRQARTRLTRLASLLRRFRDRNRIYSFLLQQFLATLGISWPSDVFVFDIRRSNFFSARPEHGEYCSDLRNERYGLKRLAKELFPEKYGNNQDVAIRQITRILNAEDRWRTEVREYFSSTAMFVSAQSQRRRIIQAAVCELASWRQPHPVDAIILAARKVRRGWDLNQGTSRNRRLRRTCNDLLHDLAPVRSKRRRSKSRIARRHASLNRTGEQTPDRVGGREGERPEKNR